MTHTERLNDDAPPAETDEAPEHSTLEPSKNKYSTSGQENASSGFTQVPNAILDQMADMSKAELKIVLAILRQTAGWQRETITLSLADIFDLTGLSRPSIVKGIEQAIERGLLERTVSKKDNRDTFEYRILLVKKLNQITPSTSKETKPKLVKKPYMHNKVLNKELNKGGGDQVGLNTKAADIPVEPIAAATELKSFYESVQAQLYAKHFPFERWKPDQLQLFAQLGQCTDLDVLEQVFLFWKAKGHHGQHIDGMLSKYGKLLAAKQAAPVVSPADEIERLKRKLADVDQQMALARQQGDNERASQLYRSHTHVYSQLQDAKARVRGMAA